MRILISLLLFVFMPLSGMAAVQSFTLENGLKLLIKEDHRAPVVITQVWYKVGSAYETTGLTGISHALEHMMFKGTPKYAAGEYTRLVARKGGLLNAFTSTDYTAYWEMLPKDELSLSFELESDRMRHLNLDPEEFAKEIRVVMEERRLRTDDDPLAQLRERFMAAAFVAVPYHHPTVGWMSDLKQMTIDDLRTWYKTWYAPNNAIVVVVGDVKPEQVLQLAKKYFEPLQQSSIPVLKRQPNLPAMGKRRVEVNVAAKLPYLLLGYNTPTLGTAHEKWHVYALAVLAGILDGGNSARFEKNIVRTGQIATSIWAGYDLYSLFPSLFSIGAVPAQKHTVDELRQAINKEIINLQKNLVSSEELARVKAQVVAMKTYELDSISHQASEIGSLESIGLSWQDGENFVDRVNAVSAEQVRSVAQLYLVPENLTDGELKPLKQSEKKQEGHDE